MKRSSQVKANVNHQSATFEQPVANLEMTAKNPIILIALPILLATSSLTFGEDQVPQPPSIGESLPMALPVTGKQFAFIFDDGPRPESTPELLDALKQANMKATFSLVGQNVSQYPDLARRIVAEGHEVANRTWSNAELTSLTSEAIKSEIQAGYDIIVSVTGVKPRFLRPPGSQTSPEIASIAASVGLMVLMQSLDSGDWREPVRGEVTRVILTGITPGALVLAHESFPRSVAEMPKIIEALAERGYRSRTVSDLKSQVGSGFFAGASFR